MIDKHLVLHMCKEEMSDDFDYDYASESEDDYQKTSEIGSEDESVEGDKDMGSSKASRKLPDNHMRQDNHALKKAKFSLPNKDEQLQLQNTDALMKTNLLRLQTEEMLSEVSATGDFEKKKVTNWLNDVLTLLKSANKMDGTQITQSWLGKAGILLGTSSSSDTSIIYSRPTSVDTVGSYSLKTATTPILNIDVAVSMPSACFEARDILNHTYFVKRRLYLGALWSILSKNEGLHFISVALFKGDIRKPILLLRPLSFKSKVSIRIIPVAPTDVFKLAQLRTNKNNVRPDSWMKAIDEGKKGKTAASLDASTLKGTPHYNLSLLEDLAVTTQHRILFQTMSVCPVARQAVILFKVWLTQRSMRFAMENIDGHSATLIVAYLVQIKRIAINMTPLSAFQVILRFLTEANVEKSSFDFMSTTIAIRDPENDEFLHTPFVLLHPLVDQSSSEKQSIFHYNCMWRVTMTAFNDFIEEARISLRFFENSAGSTTFTKLFMQRSTFYDRHDVFFHVPFEDSLFDKLTRVLSHGSDAGESHHMDIFEQRLVLLKEGLCDCTPGQYMSQELATLVTEALGNRVTTVRVILSHSDELLQGEMSVFSPQWDTKSLGYAGRWVLTVGIVLQKDSSHRRVERGPSAEETEAGERFRRFWGPNKSKLRRFQDGSIIEAVVWDEAKNRTAALRGGYIPRGERIVEEIVRYIAGRHLPFPCGANGENIICKASFLEQYFLPAAGIISEELDASLSSRDTSDADTLCRKAVERLDELRSILISKLKDLPLVVEHVLAVCPELRYTALIPPRVHPLLDKDLLRSTSGTETSLMAKPLLVVVKIESGGRWPTEAEAVLNIKAALYLRLGELLVSQFQIHSVPHKDCIDVLLGGYVFRLNIIAGAETERLLAPGLKALVKAGTIDASHHNAIKALHAQNPSFGNAVRLLSRWCSGNYFSGLLTHEALELLVACVYVDPEFGGAPSSPSAGFRRALLKLATHDWENLPLIVDFSNELTLADKLLVMSRFQACRESKAGPAMFLVSNLEKDIEFDPVFVSETPSRVVLRMITSAAARSGALVGDWVRQTHFDLNQLDSIMDSTVSNLSNVTLPFSKSLVFSKQSSTGKELWDSVQRGPSFARLQIFSNMSVKEMGVGNMVIRGSTSIHPIQEEVINKLRRLYGDIALFFWNDLRGSEVSVVWKPAAFLPEKFKILRSANRVTMGSRDASQDAVTILNVAEMLQKMVAVGDGVFDLQSVNIA